MMKSGIFFTAFLFGLSCQTALRGADAENSATLAKNQGGLVIQLGDPNAEMASELANTGRYIIHLLDTERGKIEKARTVLHERQVYGVASAETVADRLARWPRLLACQVPLATDRPAGVPAGVPIPAACQCRPARHRRCPETSGFHLAGHAVRR